MGTRGFSTPITKNSLALNHPQQRHHILRSYECRRGRPLTAAAIHRLHHNLADYALPFEIREATHQQWNKLLAVPDAIALEIGSGRGDVIHNLAKTRKNVLFIAAEPFTRGVASLLYRMEEDDNSHDNLRIYPDDGRFLLITMPSSFLSEIFVLFPDPWPKRRHHKRRLINEDFLMMIDRVLVEGGLLHVASDSPSYILQIGRLCRGHGGLLRCSPRGRKGRIAPHYIASSRYLAKAKEAGRDSLFLTFQKKKFHPKM